MLKTKTKKLCLYSWIIFDRRISIPWMGTYWPHCCPDYRSLTHSLSWQMTNQATHSQRTSTLDTSSVSSGQPEKPEKEGAHASTQAISCVNLRWVFHWLREQILSSLLGRQHPEEATEQPHQRARKKRLSHRGKRIQPQDSLELGHPLSPDNLYSTIPTS